MLTIGPTGGAGVQRGLFPLLLYRASTEAWSRERLCPQAPLASMDSLASLSQSSSISMGSLCSFPEPWPSAMAKLAVLNRSAPSRPPKSIGGPVASRRRTVTRTHPPLEPVAGTAQEQVPGDKEHRAQRPIHLKPTSSIPTAMATATGELIPELIRVIRANQVSMEQRCNLLRELQAQHQGGEDGGTGACGGTSPGELPCPHMRKEEQVHLRVWPQSLGADLP